MPDRDERNLEKLYRSAVAGLYARLKSNYDFIYGKYGDDGIDLIADMSREYGLSIAERARNRLHHFDISSVARFILRIFNTIAHGTTNDVRLYQESDSIIVIRVTACPLHFTLPKMCLAHTEMEKIVVESLNPDLRYRIGKSLPAGDPFCEHIIECGPSETGVNGQ